MLATTTVIRSSSSSSYLSSSSSSLSTRTTEESAVIAADQVKLATWALLIEATRDYNRAIYATRINEGVKRTASGLDDEYSFVHDRVDKVHNEFMRVSDMYNYLAGGLPKKCGTNPETAYADAIQELSIEARLGYDDASDSCKFIVARCEEIYSAYSNALKAHQNLLQECRFRLTDTTESVNLSFQLTACLLEASQQKCVELEKARGEAEIEEDVARTLAAKARSEHMEVCNLYSDWMYRKLKSQIVV